MNHLTKTVLYTDESGRSRFRDETMDLSVGTPQIQKTPAAPCKAWQFRYSPVGFSFDFHCSDRPLWVVILRGRWRSLFRMVATDSSMSETSSSRQISSRMGQSSTRTYTARDRGKSALMHS